MEATENSADAGGTGGFCGTAGQGRNGGRDRRTASDLDRRRAELWEWGQKQEPLNIGFCTREPYVLDVDFYLSLFSVQQLPRRG